MKAFAYVNPANEKDAVAALRFDGVAMPLAGGQDLLARMKDYIAEPDRIVNVNGALDATITALPDGGSRRAQAHRAGSRPVQHRRTASRQPAGNHG